MPIYKCKKSKLEIMKEILSETKNDNPKIFWYRKIVSELEKEELLKEQ